LQLDELAAGALGFIPVTGVRYAIALRPRYRENDALTDVLIQLKHDLDLVADRPDTGCTADQTVATSGHAKITETDLLLLLAHFGKEGTPQPILVDISQETCRVDWNDPIPREPLHEQIPQTWTHQLQWKDKGS
jgi:hypothetical protein